MTAPIIDRTWTNDALLEKTREAIARGDDKSTASSAVGNHLSDTCLGIMKKIADYLSPGLMDTSSVSLRGKVAGAWLRDALDARPIQYPAETYQIFCYWIKEHPMWVNFVSLVTFFQLMGPFIPNPTCGVSSDYTDNTSSFGNRPSVYTMTVIYLIINLIRMFDMALMCLSAPCLPSSTRGGRCI